MGKTIPSQPELAPIANESQIQPDASRGLPKPASAEIADRGRIRFGAGFRLPADRRHA
jgi:hypothetical protein